MNKRGLLGVGLALVLGLLLANPARAQEAKGDDALMTEENAITGTMDIDFKTRTELDTDGTYTEGSPRLGAKDTYKFNLTVAKTTEYQGTVTRQGDLFTRVIRSQKQKGQLQYDVNLAVRNPRNLNQKINVGKWVGTVPMVSATGLYDIAAGAKLESALRIAIDAR